jgi:exodeoxyribonuclease VII large subunit
MEDINRQREILTRLTDWRNQLAHSRGVPEYLILPNTTINAIAQALPKDEHELIQVKGVKEGKMREFGRQILSLVNDEFSERSSDDIGGDDTHSSEDVLRVSTYLDVLNRSLRMTGTVRIIGEVGQVKLQGSAVYFSLRDKDDASILSLFMWKSLYDTFGIELEEGMEVVASGISEIYKPTGRISFRTETLELVGEGALKKAYEVLKKKLQAEGVFDVARKRQLPEYPVRIGLITSKTGAVIHDFLNNLGKFGYQVTFVDSRVEGVLAVNEILRAIRALSTVQLDALVIVRGGGSFESLQAFNNEEVVRALSQFPFPVVCAIGHDQDVPLAQLVADYAPSTPTACTTLFNESWNKAGDLMRFSESEIFHRLQNRMMETREQIRHSENIFATFIDDVILLSKNINSKFEIAIQKIERQLDLS